ncbi:MAG: lectin-like protein [Phycisphaerales bacterium]
MRCYLASNVPNIDGGLPFSNWIGLNDVASEGNFVWWCAEPVNYTNWQPGEPNNGGNSDFTELLGDTGQWRDRGNAAVEYGVVEYEFIVCGTGGGCFSTHAAPGCNNESCCQTVCFIDNFCCNNSWDGVCVNEANGLCNAPVLAGPFLNPANKHNYYLLDTGAWSEAQERAQTLHGYLATINNAAENTWVLNNVSRYDGDMTRSCFIGYNDQLVEGTFQWVDHATSTYTNWAAGEPNNSGGVENFAEMMPNGKWNDNDNTGTVDFSTFAIVEVPCLGDLDGNGTVDGGDLGLLLGAWNTTDKAADLNQDGVVDGSDLGLLLGGWGVCG